MSDEQHTPEPEMPDPAAEASASSMSMGDFSSGQGMVALAGMIIVAVWLIFEVIMEEYGVPVLGIVLAGAAVTVPRLNSDNVEKLHPVPTLMKAIGFGLVLVGVVEIVEEVVGGIFSADGTTIIAALLAYAGYVIAFLGVRKA